MDTDKLINTVVRSAIDAWQRGDSGEWLSHFVGNVALVDDGQPRDFRAFSTEAIGHERFTSIDRVTDNGLSIFGRFHSDTWGDFKTYFKFYLNEHGKIYRLEIGQANY